ncbi:MAG: peptide chain release factor N(5)-glutamine methyltransferase [Defluviitaleaceae bacterium]|nr:peptide chain release factor N(5)-glutamine methyltransferase [Defluviitaleaceae bacterium]
MSRNSLKAIYVYGRERLRRAKIDGCALDAEVLLRHATGLDRAGMLTNPGMIIEEHAVEKYHEYLRQREQRTPVAYITNTVEFMSLPMHIDRRALIPRPDTEILVERALSLIGKMTKSADGSKKRQISILELCTGSGCIALALAHHAPEARIMATDLDADALQLASENAQRYAAGENIKFLRGDLFQPVLGLKFDMVIANPPYIPTQTVGTLDEDVRLYEPVSALDGGQDGLEFYRRLFAGLRGALKRGGVALFEIGYDQGEDVTRLLADAGFKSGIIKDLSGRDRVVLVV